MTYELKVNPKLVAFAAVGAEVLNTKLEDELLRPIVEVKKDDGKKGAKGKAVEEAPRRIGFRQCGKGCAR